MSLGIALRFDGCLSLRLQVGGLEMGGELDVRETQVGWMLVRFTARHTGESCAVHWIATVWIENVACRSLDLCLQIIGFELNSWRIRGRLRQIRVGITCAAALSSTSYLCVTSAWSVAFDSANPEPTPQDAKMPQSQDKSTQRRGFDCVCFRMASHAVP